MLGTQPPSHPSTRTLTGGLFSPTTATRWWPQKLLNVPKNKEVVVVCKILAEHVTFDNPHDPLHEGKVEFKLKIQK